MGGSSYDEVTWFARLRPGESISQASWLLRRVRSGADQWEELLGRDGEWHRSGMLPATERGELPGELRPIGSLGAGAMQRSVRRQFGVVERALARQRTGDFALRLASSGLAGEDPPLDPEGRAEFAAFLTGAPLAGDGPEGSYRTDGMWVWPAVIAAQVLATGLVPEGIFAFHIRAREFFYPAQVEPPVIERARQLLTAGPTPVGGEPVREAKVAGRAPEPSQTERMTALGSWHAEWARKHRASTPFRPELNAELEDYAEHYVDLEASPEAQAEFDVRAREILGLDPETGQRIDL
jgi:hypothetical protein